MEKLSEIERGLLSSISKEKMDELLLKFDKIDRLSGGPGERKALSYIMKKLEEYQVSYENYEFDAYLSDPIKGELEVISPEKFFIAAKTRSFSGNFPEGIEGEIIYAPGGGDILHHSDITWGNNVKGKIIVSEGGSPQHMEKAEELGAIGLIHIWPSNEDVIHEMISSPVWGTPTLKTAKRIPGIPEISVKYSDGQRLISMVKNGEVRVRIRTHVNTGVKRLNLPVAYIPGSTEKYILLAGHIDSWYMGITDNAVGNALCLEIARIFASCAHKLKRGIKIAWWPGHSNGRYAGSTWYCDNFWQDLNDNCVAYINSDSPGSKYGVINLIRTTLLEEPMYFEDIVKEITGEVPKWEFPIRAGDLSFWGPGIPIQLMVRDEPDDGHKQAKVGGSGGGWWWHSEEDSYDKADLDILVRDTKINALAIYRIANSEVLPVNIGYFAERMLEETEKIKLDADNEFDLEPVVKKFEELLAAAKSLEKVKKIDIEELNELYKSGGGILSRIAYSSCSRYYQDPAYPQKVLPGLQAVRGVGRDNTPEDKFLFIKTDFCRQRNRILNEVSHVISEINNCIKNAVI